MSWLTERSSKRRASTRSSSVTTACVFGYREGGGKIVNISSGTPFRGVPFLLHYVTSKGAIVALTRRAPQDLQP